MLKTMKPLYPKPHRNQLLEGLRPTLELNTFHRWPGVSCSPLPQGLHQMLPPLQLKLKGLVVRQWRCPGQRASQGSNSATEHQQVMTANGRERAQRQFQLGQKHAHGEGSALQCIQRGHKYGGMIPLQQKKVSPWTPHTPLGARSCTRDAHKDIAYASPGVPQRTRTTHSTISCLATRMATPNGQFLLPPEVVQSFLPSLPMSHLPAQRPESRDHLQAGGEGRGYLWGEVRALHLSTLRSVFGSRTGQAWLQR